MNRNATKKLPSEGSKRAVQPTFPTATRLRVFADGHRSVPARRAAFVTTALRLGNLFHDAPR